MQLRGRELKIDLQGEDVRLLQEELMQLGYRNAVFGNESCFLSSKSSLELSA